MSSNLTGTGDLYSLAGAATPSHLFRSDHSITTPKRPISDLDLHHHQYQQQLLRSVKPKTSTTTTHHYLHPSPISPFDLDSPTTTFNKHHTIKSRLQELEKHLLDDSDDPSTTTTLSTSASDWNNTAIQTLISPSPSSSSSSSSPPSPPPSDKHLLDTAAAAVADGNTDLATTTLSTLHNRNSTHSNPSRLIQYLTSALAYRLNLKPTTPLPLLSTADHLSAVHLLRHASPCLSLASLSILDSTRNLPTLHVIDFDVGHGSTYLKLLSSPSRPKTPLTITAVADPLNPYSTNTTTPHVVRAAGDRLAKLAEQTGVPFRFNMVTLRTPELTRRALGCDDGEPLVVNLAFYLHNIADESVSPANPRDELLRKVRELGPTLVALVEHEMNGNTAPFLARYAEASGYYAALMETLGREHAGDRLRVEECIGRRIVDVVGREGSERVERCEVFGKWRARMAMAGFRPRPVVAGESLRSNARGLNSSFSVKEESGGLLFGYSGRTLAVASAWH